MELFQNKAIIRRFIPQTMTADKAQIPSIRFISIILSLSAFIRLQKFSHTFRCFPSGFLSPPSSHNPEREYRYVFDLVMGGYSKLKSTIENYYLQDIQVYRLVYNPNHSKRFLTLSDFVFQTSHLSNEQIASILSPINVDSNLPFTYEKLKSNTYKVLPHLKNFSPLHLDTLQKKSFRFPDKFQINLIVNSFPSKETASPIPMRLWYNLKLSRNSTTKTYKPTIFPGGLINVAHTDHQPSFIPCHDITRDNNSQNDNNLKSLKGGNIEAPLLYLVLEQQHLETPTVISNQVVNFFLFPHELEVRVLWNLHKNQTLNQAFEKVADKTFQTNALNGILKKVVPPTFIWSYLEDLRFYDNNLKLYISPKKLSKAKGEVSAYNEMKARKEEKEFVERLNIFLMLKKIKMKRKQERNREEVEPRKIGEHTKKIFESLRAVSTEISRNGE